MELRVLIVQHGEKNPEPGDPGLTPLGQRQAQRTATWLVEAFEVTAMWSSPLRRALETAAPLVESLGIDLAQDRRLRERMNWEADVQSVEDFLAEWRTATDDRAYVPVCGDSSAQAARRCIDALNDIAAGLPAGATTAVFTHGGVTVDALRTIAGDDHIVRVQPELLTDGVPCGAVTILETVSGKWEIIQLPSTAHLDAAEQLE